MHNEQTDPTSPLSPEHGLPDAPRWFSDAFLLHFLQRCVFALGVFLACLGIAQGLGGGHLLLGWGGFILGFTIPLGRTRPQIWD